MSNHAYVKTKKVMNTEMLTELIFNLNQRVFKNNLLIEYEGSKRSGFWDISYVSPIDHKKYVDFTFWLNTSRSLELAHSGGSDFSWWVDFAITNEVAVKFDGMISDDALGKEKWSGVEGKYDDFESCLTLQNQYLNLAKPHIRESILKSQRLLCPPEFQNV